MSTNASTNASQKLLNSSSDSDYDDTSLLFVKDNLRELIRDVYHSDGDITDSVNFTTHFKVLTETNKIMISNDTFLKENLKLLVSETIKKYLLEYDNYFNHIFSVLKLNLEDEVEKLTTIFWSMVLTN
jgi:hypothetical protein